MDTDWGWRWQGPIIKGACTQQEKSQRLILVISKCLLPSPLGYLDRDELRGHLRWGVGELRGESH